MGEHDLKVFIQMLCTIWNVKTVLSLQPTKMAFFSLFETSQKYINTFSVSKSFYKTVMLNWLNHAQIFSHLLLCFCWVFLFF